MKIRTGFVSNSSSSSFIVYGGYFNNSVVFNAFCKKNELGEYIDENDEELKDEWEIKEFIEYKDNWAKENNLNFYFIDDSCYIGRHPSDFDDNKTMGESKEEIKRLLQEKFKDNNLKVYWHEEEIYS